MFVLGVNAFHADAAAALLCDGRLIAAAEEERFTRIKHWAGFPARSIAWCLQKAGASLADVAHIAVNQDNCANHGARLTYLVSHPPRLGLWRSRLRTRTARMSADRQLAAAFPDARFLGAWHRVEHHLAHLASAYLVSPFGAAAAASVDGFGDFVSAAWGRGEGDALTVEERIVFPHSLGLFYQALTQYLGFDAYGDEYKVMGLAAYGRPRHSETLGRVLRGDDGFALDLKFFRHHREAVALQWSDGAPAFDHVFTDQLELLLGPRRLPDEPLDDRHRDIAASTQAVYEDVLFEWLGAVQKKSGMTDLAFAGGCAMNSVANGKITRRTPFRRVYVPPAAGDAGGAVGAALVAWRRLGGGRGFVMDRADWGPGFSDDDIAGTLADCRSLKRVDHIVENVADTDVLCQRVARMIAEGKVVGWFQGRAEFGPRALGNRSILVDPRRAAMRQILNAKIKRRESFRPFAPSVLEEAAAEWFDDAAPVPFMSQVLAVKADKRAFIPAVTHVDGTGRVQTVARAANPRFWQLIEAFRAITGVPMLLNTSFNENEPIVLTPREALDCFLRTSMDALVLGNTMIQRTST